jgi:hypothetical protein
MISREYAAGSSSECFNHHCGLTRIKYDYDAGLFARSQYLPRYAETSHIFVIQPSPNHCNVRSVRFESCANSSSVSRVANNPSPITAPSHRRRHQLAAKLAAVGYKYSDPAGAFC